MHSDLTVPLHANDGGGGRMHRGSAGSGEAPSPMAPRVRRMTYGSEDMGEKAAKMNIDMGSSRKGSLKQERFARTYYFCSRSSGGGRYLNSHTRTHTRTCLLPARSRVPLQRRNVAARGVRRAARVRDPDA